MSGYGQSSLLVIVRDSLTREPLPGAAVILKGGSHGVATKPDGHATLDGVPDGPQVILFSFVGYHAKAIDLSFPFEQIDPLEVLLAPNAEMLDEVVVEATRSNRSVTNLPTRTEVLTEEIDEAASMEPGKIAHLITHSTGVQVQTTSATSNGAVVRIQGLQGRYTQLLKDGFPLYGGFSGSLDVMQIPPLDLRQVEYIKGSASTLYGGGAIGGLINLLTKKATQDETLLHLNASHIGSRDLNAFVARRRGRFGFTNLASLHLHRPYDADNDGFTDVPEVRKFNFNPKLYFNPDKRTEIWLGGSVTTEDRAGGDMRLIAGDVPDSLHFYQDKQRSERFTSQFFASRTYAGKHTITLRNSISEFTRNLAIREDSAGRTTRFGGRQLSTFSEANYHLNGGRHNVNVGINLYSDEFSEQHFDSTSIRDQDQLTVGGYINDLWDIGKKVSLETGLRIDRARARSERGEKTVLFTMPRIYGLYKPDPHWAFRLGGGMGYRMPTIFSEDAEPSGYRGIQPLDMKNLKAEWTGGFNLDLKYRTTFGSDKVLLTVNQLFFYNLVDDPILLVTDTAGRIAYGNPYDLLFSRGAESQVKLTVGKFTWFVGYTYTNAFFSHAGEERTLLLTPQHSIKGDLLFVVDGVWRIGWDYEYRSQQLLSTGQYSPTLFTTGVIVERTIQNTVIFLNAENFTDARQTRSANLRSDPYGTPQFTDVWAPLDGFFFNAGLKIRL